MTHTVLLKISMENTNNPRLQIFGVLPNTTQLVSDRLGDNQVHGLHTPRLKILLAFYSWLLLRLSSQSQVLLLCIAIGNCEDSLRNKLHRHTSATWTRLSRRCLSRYGQTAHTAFAGQSWNLSKSHRAIRRKLGSFNGRESNQ